MLLLHPCSPWPVEDGAVGEGSALTRPDVPHQGLVATIKSDAEGVPELH